MKKRRRVLPGTKRALVAELVVACGGDREEYLWWCRGSRTAAPGNDDDATVSNRERESGYVSSFCLCFSFPFLFLLWSPMCYPFSSVSPSLYIFPFCPYFPLFPSVSFPFFVFSFLSPFVLSFYFSFYFSFSLFSFFLSLFSRIYKQEERGHLFLSRHSAG